MGVCLLQLAEVCLPHCASWGRQAFLRPFRFPLGAMSQRYSRLGTDKLGAGWYGYVHAAWDSNQSRLVAVKVQKRKEVGGGYS